MADGTKIEWTDATWNPITGCSVVSPGCTNCYAMRLAGTRMKNHPSRIGLTDSSKAGPVWNGEVRLNEQWLHQPLLWKKPRMVFVCAHGDLFHESVPDAWIDRVFAVMALAPHHTFQVLTKRADRMHAYLTCAHAPGRHITISDDGAVTDTSAAAVRVQADICRLFATVPTDALNRAAAWQERHYPQGDGFMRVWPLPNVWLGVSAEDQEHAEMRALYLVETPAAVRWISAEPLLGPIDLTRLRFGYFDENRRGGRVQCVQKGERFPRDAVPACYADVLRGWSVARIEPDEEAHYIPGEGGYGRIDWVVAGGESGPGARSSHPDWFRSLRDQCVDAEVPFLFKQHGDWIGDDIEFADLMAPQQSDPDDYFESRNVGGPPPTDCTVWRVGKKRAGRHLDGRTWDQFPEVSS